MHQETTQTQTIPETTVRALLEAAFDALNVPVPDQRDDDPEAAELLRRRASDVRIIVISVLNQPTVGHVQAAAEQLQRWTAENPVGYASWQQRTIGAPVENGGGPR
jgi:hypothetical protein